MRTAFNLSPVIDLLDALSPTPLNPFVLDPKAVDAAGAVRSLGDFSALWQFLDDYCIDDSAPVPVKRVSTPAPAPAPALPRDKKRRRRKKDVAVNSSGSLSDSERKKNDSIVNPELTPTKRRKDAINSKGTPELSSASDFENQTDTTEEIPRVPSHSHIRITTTSRIPPKSDGLTPSDPLPQRPVIRAPQISPSERKAQLIQLIIRLFPADRPSLLNLNIPRSINPLDTNIHVFVDNSNILISFYELIKEARGYPKDVRVRAPKFSFHNFSLILERGRETAKKALVGSLPITPVVREAEALGYETSILERVVKERISKYSSSSSGSESTSPRKVRMAKVEQAVDEILHLKILESILDYPPSTIVLASGDAAAGEYSPGFFKVVERALLRGWKVELASFKKSLSFQYQAREFKGKWKDSFRFIQLDQFAELLLDEGPVY